MASATASSLARRLATATTTTLLIALALAPLARCQQTTPSPRAPISIGNEENDPRLLGYYLAPDSTERLTVSSGTVWATRGEFAGTCDSGGELSTCSIATACANSRLTYDNGFVRTCGEGAECISFTIYQTSPFGTPSATNIDCRLAWVAHTVYRQLIETMPPTPSETTRTTTPPSNTNEPEDPTPSDDPGSGSGTSRIGVAVGASVAAVVILLGLVGLGAWLYRRKRLQQRQQQQQKLEKMQMQGGGPGGMPPGEYPPFGNRTPSEFGGGSNHPSVMYGGPGGSPVQWNAMGIAPHPGAHSAYAASIHTTTGGADKYFYAPPPATVNGGWGHSSTPPPSELSGVGYPSPPAGNPQQQQQQQPYQYQQHPGGVPSLPVELPGSAPSGGDPASASSPHPPGGFPSQQQQQQQRFYQQQQGGMPPSRMESMTSRVNSEMSGHSGHSPDGINNTMGSPDPRI